VPKAEYKMFLWNQDVLYVLGWELCEGLLNFKCEMEALSSDNSVMYMLLTRCALFINMRIISLLILVHDISSGAF
jgi:hypothetical protein